MVISAQIKDKHPYLLFAFTFALMLLTYGFALTNYTLSVDNELPILADFGMELGRWGQNLILYHLFGGHLQYFSLLLSIFLFSIATIQITRLFKLSNLASYCFCALFVTFPQLSYQLVFGMMAVVSALGILLSVLCVDLFMRGFEMQNRTKKIALFSAMALLFAFTLSIYQAFALVPVTLYLILFLQSTFNDDFKIGAEIKKTLIFGAMLIISLLLYYISVKIICPLPKGGYVESFIGVGNGNFFQNFISISGTHLGGNSFYGEKQYLLVSIAVILVAVNLFLDKKYFVYRLLALVFLILSPFALAYFITNGYYPPRLYVTSNIVFAFVIVFALNRFKVTSNHYTGIAMVLVCFVNIYFVTKLFSGVNKIYKHDRSVAEKIDNIIQTKYPSFATSQKSIYFYGHLPLDYHQKFRLNNSEIFGGSFFVWDKGNNYRLLNFFSEADVADYTMITKEQFDSVKDSIAKMPVWPDRESIKMINNAVVVKLGNEKGAPLYFE